MDKLIFMWFLCTTILLMLWNLPIAVVAGTINPKKIVCKNRDKKPVIQVEQCKPVFSMKRKACEKLIRKCKCQHDIEMKWTGNGCPGSQGDGGCQCADYCGWTCPGKCRADPLRRCQYLNGECSNINNGATGPMPQCPVPTSAPSLSPICFPGESIVITRTGPKRMEDIKVGEYIQDIALHDDGDIKAGTITFTQLTAWLHHGRDQMSPYVEIYVDNPLRNASITTNETVLHLSDVHVLFIHDESINDYRSVTAQQVKVDNYVYLADSTNTLTRRVLGRVTKVRNNVFKRGFYSPMTLTGTLVVDGVHVSNYVTSYHDLVNAFCAPFRWFAKYVAPIPEWYTADGYHYYTMSIKWLGDVVPVQLYAIAGVSWESLQFNWLQQYLKLFF